MTQVALTLVSTNGKVGPIPVSTTSAKTCPDECPLKDDGCYAGSGPVFLHWRAVTELARGTDWPTFTAKIALLPDDQLWRHDQAGDLPGENNEIDADELDQLVEANRGKRGFTYTHKPLTPANIAAIRHANANGFTINLSANSMAHADTLIAANAGPVVTMLPIDYQRRYNKKTQEWLEGMVEYRARVEALGLYTPNGARVEPCPATYRDGVNCASCKLCQIQARKVIPGFPAHGARAKLADKVTRGA